MATVDKYAAIAAQYDQMLQDNPSREMFFRKTFERYHVRSILDCACGTGKDLLLFCSMGYRVVGSDISDSMLQVAQSTINMHSAEVTLRKADFHNLKAIHDNKFDAIVCLSNAINEEEVDPTKALESMKEVLAPGGIIVFDQGQTDFTMRNPPLYAPVTNNRELSRLHTMEYHQDIMTVNVFDFLHNERKRDYDFSYSQFKIRIRLYAEWKALLEKSQLDVEYYGNWEEEPYSPDSSMRLIIVSKTTTGRQ